jgi:hypothetical protein
VAAFDVLGCWRSVGAVRTCAHWLAANCGMAIGAARERVRAARRHREAGDFRQLNGECFEVRVEDVSAEAHGEEPRLVFTRKTLIHSNSLAD